MTRDIRDEVVPAAAELLQLRPDVPGSSNVGGCIEAHHADLFRSRTPQPFRSSQP